MGKAKGEKCPIPRWRTPECRQLADWISEFRAALDARGLQYGMFSHMDVGG